jgi:hypothetical protein
MDQTDITASSRLRIIFAAVAAIMLALWGWSLGAPIHSWGDPNEDGFSYVPLFWATITCLPVGLYLVARAIIGRGRPLARARTALWLGGALTVLVVAFLIFQQIADSGS